MSERQWWDLGLAWLFGDVLYSSGPYSFPVGLFVSVPSPVALLFFPLGLFVLVSGSVPSTASPLFFPVGLFVLYALSNGFLYLYLLRLLYCSFRWVYLYLPVGLCLLWLVRCSFWWVCLLCALSDEALFFPLDLSVFTFLSIVSLFFFLVGLFVFQMGRLVTLIGMCIFYSKYLTSWVFK